ncbi:type IX secretion system lipoprotein PorK/GldK [Sunxiuqinia sp. A32]|uniref:type IX secretion system lipoprotein PorK/GldK n=1 Tax=Sunxiuqinia sp. A32 TaxID=3461496 RepID=UPI0040452507
MIKSTFIFISLILILSSCRNDVMRQYIEGAEKEPFYEPTPYGMSYIERGSYEMGPEDDELQQEFNAVKRISVESFWMDDTEITNNEYRQFVYWVRDSIARQILSETFPEYMVTEDGKGNYYDIPKLNWMDPIEWDKKDFQDALEDLYVPEAERFYHQRVVDSRKLFYSYHWVDYKQAAKRANSYNFETQKYEGSVVTKDGEEIPIANRSSFIMQENTPVYPDTLCWVRDFTYSYNEPLTSKYFWHPGFDDYPVVGITWEQARSFCHWRTKEMNEYQSLLQLPELHDYRLPTEAEWEYAARGKHERTLYPWGSYYTTSDYGCFVANFKPRRGNYVADNNRGCTTIKVGSFDPNDVLLYDMAGNVSEWTSTAFYESAYNSVSDFNPTVEYEAKPDDPPVLKRKVIRGGSWKDIAYFLRNGTRSYEYQDSAKSYIGFRCVRTSFKDEFHQ